MNVGGALHFGDPLLTTVRSPGEPLIVPSAGPAASTVVVGPAVVAGAAVVVGPGVEVGTGGSAATTLVVVAAAGVVGALGELAAVGGRVEDVAAPGGALAAGAWVAVGPGGGWSSRSAPGPPGTGAVGSG